MGGFEGAHDHSNLSGAISDSLSEWCIDLDKDVTAFTADNGSNVVKAIEEDLDKVCLLCAGYTLNLSVQKAIICSKKVVEQSSPHREELENKQEMLYIFPQTHIMQCHNRLNLFNVLTSAAGSTTQVEFSVQYDPEIV